MLDIMYNNNGSIGTYVRIYIMYVHCLDFSTDLKSVFLGLLKIKASFI